MTNQCSGWMWMEHVFLCAMSFKTSEDRCVCLTWLFLVLRPCKIWFYFPLSISTPCGPCTYYTELRRPTSALDLLTASENDEKNEDFCFCASALNLAGDQHCSPIHQVKLQIPKTSRGGSTSGEARHLARPLCSSLWTSKPQYFNQLPKKATFWLCFILFNFRSFLILQNEACRLEYRPPNGVLFVSRLFGDVLRVQSIS